MVSSVEEGSFAEDIEMESGDIIVAINRHPMASVDDLRKVAESLKSGDAVAFLVVPPRLLSTPSRKPASGSLG